MRRAIKVARTKRSGAEVVFYDRYTEDRDAIAAAHHRRAQARFVAPFDNFHVMAGQGTAGLELAEQAKAAGADALEAVLVPCSGGGLAAGFRWRSRPRCRDAKVYTVEPAGFDDYARSLASGQRERNAPGAASICDALLVQQPGELTFAVKGNRLAGGLAVPDDEVRRAVAFAFNELKLVVEPGGAVGSGGAAQRTIRCCRAGRSRSCFPAAISTRICSPRSSPGRRRRAGSSAPPQLAELAWSASCRSNVGRREASGSNLTFESRVAIAGASLTYSNVRSIRSTNKKLGVRTVRDEPLSPFRQLDVPVVGLA